MATGPQSDFEARLSALEQTVAHFKNPGHLSTAEAVSIKEYFETRLAAIEQATHLASNTMDKRLDGMNEFRETLRDQASRFVTRDEVALQLARQTDFTAAERGAMKEQIAGLQTFQDKLEGKASMNAMIGSYLLSIASLALGMISLLKG